jgi:dipeptidyl aminopeptidase/acylaminoacyl peptidase
MRQVSGVHSRVGAVGVALVSLSAIGLSQTGVAAGSPADTSNSKVSPGAADQTGHRGTDPARAARLQNGRIISFAVDPGTGGRSKTIRVDGTHLRTLVRDPHASVTSPVWSRDGHRVAYSRAGRTGCHIILAHRDGTHRRDLTGNHSPCEQAPTFSPSGQRIIFATQHCDACRTWIAGMDRFGRHRHRILPIPAGTSTDTIALSPDGRRIAFEAGKDPDVQPFHRALFVARRDGTHLRTLVPYRLDAGSNFDWSSTGRWLVYTRWSENPNGHEANVVLIRPNGSSQHRLTSVHRTGRSAGGATFSPDGQMVVYRFSNLDSGHYSIRTIHVDGTHNRLIRRFTVAPPQGIHWAPKVR